MIEQKMHSEDRMLNIEHIPNAKSTSLIDPKLFTGEQEIHAVRGPFDNLWRVKYNKGTLPTPLKQSFTNFQQLFNFCVAYFGRRGVKVTGFTDVYKDSDY